MITPLSPIVKRKSIPQKVTQIAVKLWKKYLNPLINVFLNISKRFITVLKSLINREFN